MATVRYQVDQVPQNEWASAFFPPPCLSPAGQFSIGRMIHGFPGTWRIQAPDAAGSQTLSKNPDWAPWSDSRVSPNWFAPQLWWNDVAELGGGGSSAGNKLAYLPRRRAQVVPPFIPQGERGIQGPGPVAMGGRKIGGRRSMHWLRSIPRWPNLAGEQE